MIAFLNKEPIDKGWSGDQKHCVADADGAKYLLRISPAEQYDRKRHEFEMMRRVAALGVPMCQPVEFGVCAEGVYSLQSWIDGDDAEAIIPTLPDGKQYAYGLEAGRILRRIHSIPAPATQEDWEIRFNRKIDRKIQVYGDCPIQYENGQVFIDYINANRHLLKNRPQCFQHGDYHCGNFMIDRGGVLNVIDFGRFDFGDPWEDMKSITWDIQMSPLFASGRINGYFRNRVPSEFWSLLALYISSGTLSSLPWAIPFGQGEIDTMTKLAKQVLSWYDNMQEPVPSWYVSGFHEGEPA